MPKEVVSAQVVSNWFANKRKEIRRKTNQSSAESLGYSQAFLEQIESHAANAMSAAPSSEGGLSPTRDDHSVSPPEAARIQAQAQYSLANLPPPDMRVFEALGIQPLGFMTNFKPTTQDHSG